MFNTWAALRLTNLIWFSTVSQLTAIAFGVDFKNKFIFNIVFGAVFCLLKRFFPEFQVLSFCNLVKSNAWYYCILAKLLHIKSLSARYIERFQYKIFVPFYLSCTRTKRSQNLLKKCYDCNKYFRAEKDPVLLYKYTQEVLPRFKRPRFLSASFSFWMSFEAFEAILKHEKCPNCSNSFSVFRVVWYSLMLMRLIYLISSNYTACFLTHVSARNVY